MDEEATQSATQPLPGHEGVAPSSVHSNYLAGVICLLHPSSPAAFTAVERLSRIKPTHVLKIPDTTPGRTPNNGSDVAIPEANAEGDDDDDDDDDDDPATQLAAPGQVCDEEGLDIALRAVPGPKDPLMGFMFGRNPNKCDIVIGETSKTRRISNQHFRIFQNLKGVLMLEDFSTNGTWVDHVKLGGLPGGEDHGNGSKHALFAGSIINVAPGEELLRFVVRIPNQSGSGLCPPRTPPEGSIVSQSITGQFGVGIDPGPVPPTPRVAPHLRPTVPRSPHKNLAAIRRTPGPLQAHEMHTSTSIHKDLGWNGGGIYKIEGIIGSGAFATVKRGILKKTGEVFAIKIIQKRAFANQANMGGKTTGVRKEVEILEKLHHPNIVGCAACYEDIQHIYIVMEFVEGGDLNEYLKKNHRMREDMVQEVSRQVLRGIEYVHSMGISHRDLKPDNILMVSEDPMMVKISDFGLAKMIQSEETFLKTFCGTMLYLAPEVYPGYATALVAGANSFKRKRNPREEAGREDGRSANMKRRYNQAVDMWSLGCVVHMLLTGKAPFEGKNQDDMLRLILKGYTNTSLLERVLGRGCDDVKDFIKRLLQVNPAMRMMEQEALNHAWLKNESDISSSSMEVEEIEEEVIYREDGEYQMIEGEMGEKWTKVPSSTPNHWADPVDGSDDEEGDTPKPEDSLSGAVRKMSFQSVRSRKKVTESHEDSVNGSFLSIDNAESQIGSKMFRRPPDISIQGSSGDFPVDSPSLYSTASVGLPENGEPLASPNQPCGFDKRAGFASPVPSSNPRGLQAKGSTASSDSLGDTEAMVGNLRVVSPVPGEEPSHKANEMVQQPNDNKMVVQKNDPMAEASNMSSFSDPAVVYSTPLSLMAPAETVPATPPTPHKMANPDNHLPLSQPCNVQPDSGKFIKPNAPWGKLVPLVGSIPHGTISLNRQMITIGRSSTCTHVQTDIRISKTHFAMMLADPNLSVQPVNDMNWRAQPHMIAWFKVAGTNGCLLNGKKKKKDGIGRIYNGDIIHLFKDTSDNKNDYLAFRCELKIGDHRRYEAELSDEDMSVKQKTATAQHGYSMGISMATTMAIASPFSSHEEESSSSEF